jgi:hypothetical protein
MAAGVHGPQWAYAGQSEATLAAGFPQVVGARQMTVKASLPVPGNESTLALLERVEAAERGLRVSFDLSADRDASVNSLHVSMWLPVEAAAGTTVEFDDGRSLVLPAQRGAPTLISGTFKKVSFHPRAGAGFSVELTEPSPFLVHDLRNWNDERFELRILCLTEADRGKLAAGEVRHREFAVAFDSPLQSAVLNAEGIVLRRDMDGWLSWQMPWDDDTDSITNVSGLLHKPAGRFGFLQVRDGHYAWANGERQRFWGVDISADACFPPKEVAPAIARRLAKFGVNVVRPTIDTTFGWPTLVDMNSPDKTGLDTAVLDRFDFFVNELKKNGIYVHLDLQWTRHWFAEDGFLGTEVRGKPGIYTFSNAPMYFNERFWKVGTEWARNLLLHENPYTGLRYVDEPAVAAVQIVNESGIWSIGPGTPQPYVDELQRVWNKWLGDRYGSRQRLLAAWGAASPADDEDPARGTVSILTTDPPARDADRRRFLYEIERDYYARFYRLLRDLGVKCPITCTNGPTNLAQTYACTVGDAIEFNAYWDHPHREWRWFYNRPMLRALDGANLIRAAASASVAGKPFTYTEFNFCGANEYRCEGPMLMAAYGALQDWDGIIWYTYAHPDEFWTLPSSTATSFDVHQAPQIIGQFPAAARAFLTGAIAPAKTGVDVVLSEDEAFLERGWTWSGWCQVSSGSPPTLLPFLTRMRNRFEKDKLYRGGAAYALDSGRGGPALAQERAGTIVLPFAASSDSAAALANLLRARAPDVATGLHSARHLASDTGQLDWDGQAGRLTVVAPQVRAVVGFGGGRRYDLGDVTLIPQSEFSAVSLVTVDGRPVAESTRLLLTAVARAGNSGETWMEGASGDEFRIEDQGAAPVLVEPVAATVLLPFSEARVYALEGRGARRTELKVGPEGGRVRVDIGGSDGSLWYEIVRR